MTMSTSGFVIALGAALVSRAHAAPLPVWPAPRGPVSTGAAAAVVSTSLSVTGGDAPDVAAGVARFLARAFPHPTPRGPSPSRAAAAITTLALTVTDGSAPLQYGVDESYVLSVPEDASAITLVSPTQYGALAGLETLSQLIVWDAPNRTYAVSGAPLSVSDSPAFSWRGLLIDTARHFQPVASLRAIVDSMTMAKLNVLHWHIVVSARSSGPARHGHPTHRPRTGTRTLGEAFGVCTRVEWARPPPAAPASRAVHCPFPSASSRCIRRWVATPAGLPSSRHPPCPPSPLKSP